MVALQRRKAYIYRQKQEVTLTLEGYIVLKPSADHMDYGIMDYGIKSVSRCDPACSSTVYLPFQPKSSNYPFSSEQLLYFGVNNPSHRITYILFNFTAARPCMHAQ